MATPTLSWQDLALIALLLLASASYRIAHQFAEWLEWENQIKQEELRGMEAHHRQRFGANYDAQEEKRA